MFAYIQGGNFWTLFTPEIWKVLHAVLQLDDYLRQQLKNPAIGMRLAQVLFRNLFAIGPPFSNHGFQALMALQGYTGGTPSGLA